MEFNKKQSGIVPEQSTLCSIVDQFVAQAHRGNQLAVRDYPVLYRGLTVKVSFGKGRPARVPWVAFLAKGQFIAKGIYPLLLLYRAQNVAICCYGESERRISTAEWSGLDVPSVTDWFTLTLGRPAPRYGSSFVHSVHDLSDERLSAAICSSLDAVIERYFQSGIALPHSSFIGRPGD